VTANAGSETTRGAGIWSLFYYQFGIIILTSSYFIITSICNLKKRGETGIDFKFKKEGKI